MKKDTSPGLWNSSCSGHVDAGEDYDATAVRELKEELGLTVRDIPKRWFRVEPCEATGQEFCWIYRITSGGPFVLHPEEIEGGDWLEPAEVTRRIAEKPEQFSASFRLIWRIAQEKLSGLVEADSRATA